MLTGTGKTISDGTKRPLIDILVPCFNEEECLPFLFQTIERQCDALYSQYQLHLILVNDGSSDQTLRVAREEMNNKANTFQMTIIDFSRNFGKEAALYAGLLESSGNACVIMDADLQDPADLIPQMLHLWSEGSQVVNAVRKDRRTDSWSKRVTAFGFYHVFLRLSRLGIELNASDFRLLDHCVVQAIVSCEERVRFSKGFFAWAGFKQDNLYYVRTPRLGGEGKWGAWKLWNYALDGIFNFSTAPLRIWTYLGLAVTTATFSIGLITTIRALLGKVALPGYASIFTAVTFLGGLQMIGIGILGEYLGRIYIETKRRPLFLIRAKYDSVTSA